VSAVKSHAVSSQTASHASLTEDGELYELIVLRVLKVLGELMLWDDVELLLSVDGEDVDDEDNVLGDDVELLDIVLSEDVELLEIVDGLEVELLDKVDGDEIDELDNVDGLDVELLDSELRDCELVELDDIVDKVLRLLVLVKSDNDE